MKDLSGVHLWGGGGSIAPPKTGGGWFGKRAQLTGTNISFMNSGAEGAENFFEH